MNTNDANLEPSSESLREREAFAKMMWLGGIMAFFGVQAVIWAIAIWITHSDPSHAVAPEYNNPNQTWENKRDLFKASEELGWTTKLTPLVGKNSSGEPNLELQILDREGEPVVGGVVSVRAFQRAQAGLASELLLNESEPGRYTGSLDFSAKGYWQFEVKASRGDDTFIETLILPLGVS